MRRSSVGTASHDSFHRTRTHKLSGLSDSPPRRNRVPGLAIDGQHGRNGMFENKLHTCPRLQQNYKLVKGGQLPVQSDAAHEEHAYSGLVIHERLQKSSCTLGRGVMFKVKALGPLIVPVIPDVQHGSTKKL